MYGIQSKMLWHIKNQENLNNSQTQGDPDVGIITAFPAANKIMLHEVRGSAQNRVKTEVLSKEIEAINWNQIETLKLKNSTTEIKKFSQFNYRIDGGSKNPWALK